MTAAMGEDRLAEIESVQLGEWMSEPWFQRESEDCGHGRYEVHTAGSVVLAHLPDWAAPIALWMADAHEAVPELLAEVRRLREAEAARATVRPGSRRNLLLAEITRTGGEWTIGRVKSFYTGKDFGHMYRATMRADLGGLHKAGYLVMHDTNGRRFYTLAGGAK